MIASDSIKVSYLNKTVVKITGVICDMYLDVTSYNLSWRTSGTVNVSHLLLIRYYEADGTYTIMKGLIPKNYRNLISRRY